MSTSDRHILLRYLDFVKPYRLFVAIIIVAGIGKFTVPLLVPYFAGRIVDEVALNNLGLDRAGRVGLLWQYAWMLLGVAVVESALIFVRGYFTVRTATSMSFDVREALWHHLQRLSLGFHQSRPTGSILSRLMSDVSVSQQMVNRGIFNVCIDAGSGLVAVIVLLSISWELTLLVLAILPVYGYLYRKLNPRLRQASRDVQEQNSVMSGAAVERLAGIAVVQSFAQEPEEGRFFAEQADELRSRTMRRGRLNQTLSSASNFLITTAKGAVWVVGAYMVVAMPEQMTVGHIIQFTGSAAALYLPIRRFSQINITLQTSMAAIERIFAIFDVVPELRNRRKPVKALPEQGEVAFDDVRFRYNEAGPDVLENLSFRIEPGQRVAIVGESGAGKSTLVTLIPRLYDVTDGAIRIDGIDVRDYRLRKLRQRIGIVLQDTILFSGPLRENLRYGRKDATDAEIIEAAKLANAHEFIVAMDEGYDTLIGEQGTSLSGGQKQRISLARTILQDPKILILDEATSSLDSESENLITEALERVMKGRTCVIIAHRLSTVLAADRILVFRRGKLVEDGTHTDLLAAGGYYSYLFDQQFGPLQELIAASTGNGDDE